MSKSNNNTKGSQAQNTRTGHGSSNHGYQKQNNSTSNGRTTTTSQVPSPGHKK